VTRDRAVLASAFNTLQQESGGRMWLGIGRGDSSLAHIGKEPAPVSALERYVIQLQQYLRGELVDRDGFRAGCTRATRAIRRRCRSTSRAPASA
jgi:alkanesulfonate monooxygenase SsuD/methylene tetrahydromethanopterin reductase-like flavin-dependent oxidoreductase (luciferase family)